VIAPSKVKAVFVRHPDTTVQGKISKGQTDYPLDEEGEKQSGQIAETAAKLKPKVVFSSPLQRAKIPAKKLAEKTGADLRVTPKLLPWDFGNLSGQPESKAEPVLRDLWRNHPDKPAGDTGESFNAALGRERDFVTHQLLPSMNEGLRPAVVFHSRQSRQLPHLMQGKPTADPTTGGLPPAGIEALDTSGKFKKIRRLGPA